MPLQMPPDLAAQTRPPFPAHAGAATIRVATPDDLAAINDLTNHSTRTSYANYADVETTLAERVAWFENRDPRLHPVTVAEVEGTFAGWAGLSMFRPRAGYRFTAENSVYVMPELHGRGIGTALMNDLLARGRAAGLRCIVSVIDAGQPQSIALHRRLGFEEAGRLTDGGFKFGGFRDVVFLQRVLSP